MKTYGVRVPIAGWACVEVEAENEKDAENKALDSVTADDLEEWEPLRMIVQGNICYAPLWEVEAECLDDDE